jgi:membrane protease YdiL (CAAX protease family)
MEELLANADPENQLLYSIINWGLLLGGLVVAFLLVQHQRFNPPDKRALTETVAARSWSTPEVVLLLAMLLLLYFMASFVGLFFYEDQIPLARLGTALVIYLILLCLIAGINHKHKKARPMESGMGMDQIKTLFWAPIFYLAVIPLMMLASRGYQLLLEYFFEMEVELQEVAQHVVLQELTWLETVYILMAIFVAPIFEELVFRGVVFPYCVKRIGLASSTVLVSILFSLMHFHLPSAFPLFLLSGALCLAYWRTGSLWVSIGMHAIFNTITVLALNIVS